MGPASKTVASKSETNWIASERTMPLEDFMA